MESITECFLNVKQAVPKQHGTVYNIQKKLELLLRYNELLRCE